MAARQISIRLSVEDAEKVRAHFRNVSDEGRALLQALETGSARAAAGQARLAKDLADVGTAATTANDNAARSAGRFGQAMGSAGYQIQDFAVQVQGGTSALTALSQQGSQFLGVFGTGGAWFSNPRLRSLNPRPQSRQRKRR